jgi:hypothetical protein
MSYVFGFGGLHVRVHVPVDVDVDAEPDGYDHVTPDPSGIDGTGQHPLLFNVVPPETVYIVRPDGHALI